MHLADALAARERMTCVVGAGGKKTTMYALASRLDRAVVTASVRIPIPSLEENVETVVVTDDPLAALEGATADDFPLGLVPGRADDVRYHGYENELLDSLAAAHDGPVLVKADGARMRDFKAPSDREPQIPETTDTVLPIASAHVVGEPLDENLVHRPERVAAIAGIGTGDTITADTVAAVLASDDGGLKRVPEGATAIPVVNKVDDAELADVGRDIASKVLERAGDRVERVVLTRLLDEERPVVDVVE
ncbi:selenium cofactor biosynthesis protein YqeC [Haloprofundus sp. MHR1]|uniref:selenium cofactor biosynthesis protein YqeC n=1 Tax=Haloprofundus sp. MHR1 TaxID=2572921 RepID=UPI0010BF1D1E|nr:selenium cofactor biosynthesis protein YqeC [Haloprofundus sp. MHR1]QCJ46020.1 putative selenium-dependent hydroxylase accessory protein YqeC [Haloprofundus sp. MHR1]